MFNERLSRSFEIDVYIVVTSEYTLKPVGERHFHLTPWHFPSSIHMGYTQIKMATSIFYHCSMRKELFFTMPDTENNSSTKKLEEHRPRTVRASRGTTLSCKGWQQEAALRMIMNNLDPDVAERPNDLVVYGGSGRAARSWAAFDAIVHSLGELGDDETLLVQSGKPVGIFRTHTDAPRVLIANSNLVPAWANWDHFNELDRKGLMMYGQMTAGSWIYIGSQGIVQGTYETFAEAGRQHYGGDWSGKWILTAGLGGMGGAQPLAATMAGASIIAIECDPSRIEMRLRTGYLDAQAKTLDE